MTEQLGDRMPEEILRAFDGEDLEAKIGPAYLLVTTDEGGRPRPCMLSAGEILAVEGRRLRFALWPGTHTSRNLGRGSPALFCFVAPGSVLYVKGLARSLGRSEETKLEHFEVEVDSVESDVHAGMPVTQTITFSVGSMDPTEVASTWARQLRALREA